MRKNRKQAKLEAHHVVLRKPDIEFRERTPFEAFMEQLATRYGDRRSGVGGVGEWVDFPYEEVVADGLWLVLLKAAEQLKVKPTTAHAVMEQVAPHVNRVLNGGFPLCYPTMDQAVEGFEQKVVAVANQAAATTRSPSDAWAVPCAKFFAEILASAKRASITMIELARSIKSLNTLRTKAGESVSLTDAPGGTRTLLEQASRLDIRATNQERWAHDAPAAIGRAHAILRRIKLLRELPYDLSNVADGAYPALGYIDSSWLLTQVLLAISRAPLDREYLDWKGYTKAISVLSRTPDAEALDLLEQRLLQRKPTLSRLVLALVRGSVTPHFSMMRLWGVDGELPLATLFMRNPISDPSAKQAQAHLERLATSLVTNDASAAVPEHTVTFEQQREATRYIRWDKVEDFDHLQGLVDDGVLSLDRLVENLPLCSPEVRKQAIFHFGHTPPSPKMQSLLVDMGLVEAPYPWFAERPKTFAPATLLAHLAGFLDWAVDISSRQGYPFLAVKRVFDQLQKEEATRQEAIAWLWSPEGRNFLITPMLEQPSDETESKKRRLLIKHLQGWLPPDQFGLHLLIAEVSGREHCYEIWEKENEWREISPWDQLGRLDAVSATKDLASFFPHGRRGLGQAVIRYTEEELYRLGFLGNSKQFRSFVQNKKRYEAERKNRS